MNNHQFVLEQYKKKKTPSQIHQILINEYGQDAMPFSTISYTIRKQKWAGRKEECPKKIEHHPDFTKDQKIERSLNRNPTFSIRQISSDTGIASSTVHWILTNRMGYKNKSLNKIPHELTNEMKKQRVSCSIELLKILSRLRKNQFLYFTTGDQSFFFYSTNKSKIWLPSDIDPPDCSTAKFDSPKVMMTIFWSPHGIQLIKALNPGEHFNAEYFQNEVLSDLTQLPYAISAKQNKKKFYVHFDNARPHKAKSTIQFCVENKFNIMPHPPYSPDLAPSDFFLFGYLKEKCKGCRFETVDELIEFITEIFSEINSDVLWSVFNEWEQRLNRCIQVKGNYF